MTDIVARLRQRAGNERNLRWGGPEELMVIEAADEIDRLQQDVSVVCADICAENDNLRDEIERLQKLLERPRDEGTVIAVGGEPGASAGKSE